ncbi:uncharacterized protein LOC122022383 isoform X2 [Zingiber officinale]|uniref:uncharacterized protein LOC122022383 isoform X2 n=1 Tax=Zingiber officinale TaxID=94328 RepID=UPI001C4B4136|nr:uncharacterized protein LOC122022383 isoform X2 [Zingiber officinale]
MEIDTNFSTLLQSLKVDDPWTPPKTWESIPSESGVVRCSDACGEFCDPTNGCSSISEAKLVHLVLNALIGVKTSIMEIDKISEIFSSYPADRTSHRVPTLWCRSLSTSALGKILKCVSQAGLVVYLLQKFVDFFMCPSRDIKAVLQKGCRSNSQEDIKFPDPKSSANEEVNTTGGIWTYPPYSLVNQAFAVAVKKIIQGYFGSLNTLQASVRLRRSGMGQQKSSILPDSSCGLSRFSHSGITILEVFLHTNELRTQIETLGNICFPRFANLALSREALTSETNLEFNNFPRGVDLLSYLYVQLRDADPVHQPLLKLLFVRACEPYCNFIKQWIFRANINDPYKEFLLHKSLESYGTSESVNDYFMSEIKEQVEILVPCFLNDIHGPLIRAGLQLQVLVKFLSLFDLVVGERANTHFNLVNIKEILPCWSGMPTDSVFLSNSLTFCKQRIDALIYQRQNIYQMMLEKLVIFFSKFDIRYRSMDHMVMTSGNASNMFGERSPRIPMLFLPNGSFIFSTSSDELETTKIDRSQKNTDASYTSDDSSHALEPLLNAETSSSYSSEEEIESESSLVPHSDASLADYFLFSNSFSSHEKKNLLQNSITAGRLCSSQGYYDNSVKRQGPETPPTVSCKDANISESSVFNFGGDEKSSTTPVPIDGHNSDHCWLPTSSYDMLNSSGLKEPCIAKNFIPMSNEKTHALENTELNYDKVVPPFSSVGILKGSEFMSAINQPHSLDIFTSLNSSDHYDLSANPNSTKLPCFNNIEKSKDTINNKRYSHFPYFDFAKMVDPCYYFGSMIPIHDHRLQNESSRLVNFDSSNGKGRTIDDYNQHSIEEQPHSYPTCSSHTSREAHPTSHNIPANVFGGATWVGSLKYSRDDINICTEDKSYNLATISEMPLDVVIDKCIAQETLLQYQYVSNFTIKLLEEGFDLHEHLLALRRYHFMEIADWADTFVISVCKQKWSVIEPEKKVAEIQGLLELALQRSSCEIDKYKERLYVYMNQQSNATLSTSSAGVDVFDFMLLGYRVDWPIKIIVTPAALQIYAEIFRHLFQVKLATSSLAGVWYHLKALMHSILHGHDSKYQEADLNILMKLRQQMSHFLSALQQYLHSQLSNVSWCRFQHSLKNQVKDMLDLESLHMSYLAEALHICFLSNDSKPVAAIIKNILQCVLDYGLCLTGGQLSVLDDSSETLELQSHINLSEAFAIKTAFEKNLKDLYFLYCKSPKHVDFSLCRFWDHLNYNEYYSNFFNKDMGYICL